MGFLAPWFLAGSRRVGLPVYLHLLQHIAARPLPFSSLMFFERRTQSSVKHRRLRYLLLLSLRMALLCCWRWHLRIRLSSRTGLGRARKHNVILGDRQFSSACATANHLARAKQEALQTLSSSWVGRESPGAGA